jgi:sugar lactone lactonase YvrE
MGAATRQPTTKISALEEDIEIMLSRIHLLPATRANGSIAELRSGIGIPSTIVWNSDDSRFYFADTLKDKIWSYEYDSSAGSISQEQPFFCGFDRGLRDCSAVDAEGFLWNCR